MINKNEIETPNDYFKSLMKKAGLLGVIIIIGITAYAYFVSAGITVPLIVLGAAGFLPVGFVLGGALINTQFRCRILRAITKKNLGLVHFVDGKDVHSKIKNFNKDILEGKRPDKLFYLKKGKIYNDKGEAIKKVEQETIKFQSGIPTIFFDVNNMIPLGLHEEETSIQAEQMAAIIKAHTTIQETKMLGKTKKVAGISVMVLLGLIGAVLYYAYSTYGLLQELEPFVRSAGTVAKEAGKNVVTQGGG